jgi:hypothetical protein
VECGIDSMSLNPDSVIAVVRHLTAMGAAATHASTAHEAVVGV